MHVCSAKVRDLLVLHIMYDIQFILAPISYKAVSLIPATVTGKFSFLLSLILTCRTVNRFWEKDGSTPPSGASVIHHHSLSVDVSSKRALISALVEIASLSYVEMTMHSPSSWTSIATTTGVYFSTVILAAVAALEVGSVVGIVHGNKMNLPLASWTSFGSGCYWSYS